MSWSTWQPFFNIMPGAWFLRSFFFMIDFQKENSLTLLIILLVKSLQIRTTKHKYTTMTPLICRNNKESPQSATTSRRLTIILIYFFRCVGMCIMTRITLIRPLTQGARSALALQPLQLFLNGHGQLPSYNPQLLPAR